MPGLPPAALGNPICIPPPAFPPPNAPGLKFLNAWNGLAWGWLLLAGAEVWGLVVEEVLA